MIYQIDSKIAKDVGFIGAILFHHIAFWIKKNKANQKHFHDGEYWTYSSVKGFAEYFEDLSERQIKQGLLNLKEKGFLKCGNFNKNPYDKTNWYALDKKGYSIKQSCPLDETKLSNRDAKSVQPIPDIITDNNNIYNNSMCTTDDVPHTKAKQFIPPTIEQLEAYGKDKGFVKTNFTDFWEYYENKGWRIGNVKMKSWQLALNRWERNQKQTTARPNRNTGTYNDPNHKADDNDPF